MAISQFPQSSGGGGQILSRLEVINSTQTWSHPDGATTNDPKVVYVQLVGGGGAGGYGSSPNPSSPQAPSGGSTSFGNLAVAGGAGGYPARSLNGTNAPPTPGGLGGRGAGSNVSATAGLDFGFSGTSSLSIEHHAGGGGGGAGRSGGTTGPDGGYSIWGKGGQGANSNANTSNPGVGAGGGGGGGSGLTGNPGFNQFGGSGGGGAEGFSGYYLVDGDVSVVIGAGGPKQESGRRAGDGAPGQVRIIY